MFVEVKTRQSLRFGQGDEAVHYYKTRHLKMSIEAYLSKHPTKREIRLVAAIVYLPHRKNHLSCQNEPLLITPANPQQYNNIQRPNSAIALWSDNAEPLERPAIKFLRVL